MKRWRQGSEQRWHGSPFQWGLLFFLFSEARQDHRGVSVFPGNGQFICRVGLDAGQSSRLGFILPKPYFPVFEKREASSSYGKG